jgi:hypothetical protein
MGSVSATSALGTRTDAHGLTVRVSTVPGATDLRAQMRALRAGQRVRFAGSYFNPTVETLLLEYTVHRAALVTVAVYNAAGGRVNDVVMPGVVPAGELIRISWDGRDDTGKTVPAGRYSVYLRAAAPHGISSVKGWSSIIVSYKRIVVSLWQQRLWAYNGDHLLLTTLVTTGNRLLPTPTGLFHIMFARQNFTFNSPWPVGSPFYYPPSPVHYGLYFHDDGYYLHDAPWRTVFGPGSNATTGIPGQNLTGTHGCVNVPLAAMAQLYRWATPGTVVQINA